jgi:molybdate transport system substrate-binding protein
VRLCRRLILVSSLLALLTASPLAVADDSQAKGKSVSVSAAASLSGAFRDIASQFEKAHPGLKVELNLAGSPTLVNQIQQGAHVDVFASADEANMKKLIDAQLVRGEAKVFARNRLTIAVQKGNPKKIESLADLAKPGLTIALAGPTVPVGRYAREAFSKAGVAVPEGSQELDVKAVLQKVALGEADAGIVYVTDIAGPEVEGIAIPEGQNVLASYPIATLRDAENPAGGEAFVSFVLSPDGQQTLARFGFAQS